MSVPATLAWVAVLVVWAATLAAAVAFAARRHTRTAMWLLFGLAAMVVAALIIYGVYLLVYSKADRATDGVRLSGYTVGLVVSLLLGSIAWARANNYGADPAAPSVQPSAEQGAPR